MKYSYEWYIPVPFRRLSWIQLLWGVAMRRQHRAAPACESREAVPFASAEEALFWSIAAWIARQDGARIRSGQGSVPRPCEPQEVITLGERLARAGRLTVPQWKVMLIHGRCFLPPDPHDPRQRRRLDLWASGLSILEKALKAKEIVA